MRPIAQRLEPVRPRPLAHNGDSGRGIDNSFPWYHVYFTVDLTPELEQAVLNAAAAEGFQLRVDQEHINGMLGLPGPGGHNCSHRGEFNSTSSYLIAESKGRSMRARITRDGQERVFAYGRGVDWDQRCTPPAGKAILSLSLSLPSIR
ncbi:hypothetical protein JOF56_006296 [Kibdelosporangium banguiense]|uniref:Uncharacterized protein n=1 Tax=Kibdelosporangium banguiense TaxID=1365924 RepID=A0ABS4TNC8_9PSEU|nr:hypothetical protein [Kibdelosporangium banguiense]MBP2325911.1 hypothetical protein [Kibdelosporangium banguiense]